MLDKLREDEMIDVLRSRDELDAASHELAARNLPLHHTWEKNWDHLLLSKLLVSLPLEANILDCGAGGGLTLRLLHRLGYRQIRGIDLVAPKPRVADRLKRLLHRDAFQAPFFMEQGDICRTRFADGTFDLLISVSVLEHDVDVAGFLKEAARLLKPGGVLFVSFDYWESTEEFAADQRKLCGLPWHILSRQTVEGLLRTAAEFGLSLLQSAPIPRADERVVTYAGRSYTFMAIALKKHPSASG